MSRGAATRATLHELTPWIVLAALWAAFVCARHGGLYLASDDGYIYLGYVKGALTAPRELFSYNPGEHSAGVTGMLYYYYLLVVCGLVRAVSLSSSLEADLLLGAFLANAGLLLLAAHLYLRCWRLLTDGGQRMGALTLSVAFFLFCAQPKWLWAVFVGMEGPLAAALALLLLERLLGRAPPWQASAAAALLVATRPETMLLMWLLPAFAVLVEQRSPPSKHARRPRFLRFGAAYGAAGACLTAVVLPCWVLTGKVFPSSLGTRVHLAALLDPNGLRRHLRELFADRSYWVSEWWILAAAIFLAGVAIGLRTRRWAIAWLSGFVLAFLVLRAVAGIGDFNVEDRYVSYLWPLYALGLAACVRAGLSASPRLKLELSSAARVLTPLVVYGMAAALPVRLFLEGTSLHVAAMNAIVVEPSRWMRTQLPPTARIGMEPAGALRVFTDFYLVDLIGLTTPHARSQTGNYLDFLHHHRVGWVFDRPSPSGTLLLERHAARDVRAFGQGLPWGDVHLYEIDFSAAISIAGISAEPTVQGRPRAVFDNNPETSWSRLTGGGSGFPGSRPPEIVSAEFECSAVVDELDVAMSGRAIRSPPASDAYAFEGKRDGVWTRLAARSGRSEWVGSDRAILSFWLSEPVSLDGIRVVHARPHGGPEPVIDELTLQRAGRPYVWLWSPQVRRGGRLAR